MWMRRRKNPRAVYACINYEETMAPNEIKKQSICIDTDIGEALCGLTENINK